jgi:hypothetical protein
MIGNDHLFNFAEPLQEMATLSTPGGEELNRTSNRP